MLEFRNGHWKLLIRHVKAAETTNSLELFGIHYFCCCTYLQYSIRYLWFNFQRPSCTWYGTVQGFGTLCNKHNIKFKVYELETQPPRENQECNKGKGTHDDASPNEASLDDASQEETSHRQNDPLDEAIPWGRTNRSQFFFNLWNKHPWLFSGRFIHFKPHPCSRVRQ
jgi:hypothetical protein